MKSTYSLLSRYRSELMGIAMLWVMLFHAYQLNLGNPVWNAAKAAGFGGVDIFLMLSGLGLHHSLAKYAGGYTCLRTTHSDLAGFSRLIGLS